MWSVLELVRAATEHLARNGAGSPRLDAEVLLADLLGCARLDLYVRHDAFVDDAMRARYRERVRERARGRPVSHLVGYREFYGRRFAVTADVLTPRPETEHVVDAALEALRARAARGASTPPRVADAGCGSGCLLLTLAAEAGEGAWFGTDVSAAALAVSARNAAALAAEKGAVFREGDLLTPVAGDGPFDVVVCNPPYLTRAELAEAPRDVREFEPHVALMAAESPDDPVAMHRRLLEQAAPLMAEKGRVCCELGSGAAEILEWTRARLPAARAEIRPDYAGKPRVLVVDFA